MSITIDKEFENLIPPLSAEEFQQLEENCLRDGIRDALIVWEQDGNDILIDGHNRFRIVGKHPTIQFNIKRMKFDDRDEAKLWIIRNQLGRRNLKEWDRFDLAKSLEAIEHSKARERQGTRTDIVPTLAPSQKGKTRDKLAEVVGVSHGTYDKMKAIDESKDEHLKQQVRNGDISINKGYQIAKGIEIKTKSPAKAKQERIDRAKEEHAEFKESKTVSIAQAQMDKANRQIIASNLYARLLNVGKRIEDVYTEMEHGDIDIKEMCKTLSPEQIKTLTGMFKEWNLMLAKLDKEVRNN